MFSINGHFGIGTYNGVQYDNWWKVQKCCIGQLFGSQPENFKTVHFNTVYINP